MYSKENKVLVELDEIPDPIGLINHLADREKELHNSLVDVQRMIKNVQYAIDQKKEKEDTIDSVKKSFAKRENTEFYCAKRKSLTPSKCLDQCNYCRINLHKIK